MNQSKIYANATGQTVQPSDEVLKQEAARQTEEQNIKASKELWRRHLITQQFFKEVEDTANGLIELAIAQATTYHEHQNHDLIICNLVKAHTLKTMFESAN